MNEIVEYVIGINVIIDNAIARKAEIKVVIITFYGN
jgi:hypothetical protein